MNDKAAYISGNDNSHLPSGRPNANTNFVRREHSRIVRLPEPGEEWAVRDLQEKEYPDLENDVKAFKSAGVVRYQRKEYREAAGNRVKIYKTDEDAYERAQEYVGQIDTLPCCDEGTGFKNVGSGDGEPPYECRACEARHTKETVIESGVLS